MKSQPHTSVPGVDDQTAADMSTALQGRLVSLLDLHLTLKHIHWNVVGPSFLSVHEMLDQQVEPVRAMSDAVAERIATLGGQPDGTPAAIVEQRPWENYGLGREPFLVHLKALDKVYSGVIESHRSAIAEVEKDPVTEDMLISQTGQLELFQWSIRSFIERSDDTGSA